MSRALRVKKSRSIMWSLYSLSGLAGLAYCLLAIMVIFSFFIHTSFEPLGEVMQLMGHTLVFIFVAMVLSLPFSLSLCFLILVYPSAGVSIHLKKLLKTIDQAPILICGVFFVIFLGGGLQSLYFTCSFLAVSKLSNRWLKLSKHITELQLDTAKSLGMTVWQIVFLLYIKKFYKMYIGHFLSVACFLFSVVTPFVCILTDLDGIRKLYSVYFFRLLGTGTGPISLMALILLLIHMGRLWLDSKAFYLETEHG